MEQQTYTLDLANKDDREAVAMALIRAEYTVRVRKRKDEASKKTVVYLEYWR